MSDLVERSDHEGVATIYLNRPEKLNALTPAVFVALRSQVDALAQDRTVGCVVLTGRGTSFCAGHDLESIAHREKSLSRHFEAETIDAIESLPQPVLASIQGHCYTGGLELALACDVLIAGESAVLGDTHGQWGLVPVWGMSVRLPERIGRSRAKSLMFTSRRIDAVAAASLGLVDQVVPDDELDTATARLAAEILRNSWGTNRIVKALLREGQERDRQEALEYERTLPHGLPDDLSKRMSHRR